MPNNLKMKMETDPINVNNCNLKFYTDLAFGANIMIVQRKGMDENVLNNFCDITT